MIHVTFVRSNFRSSGIAQVLRRQAVPEFVIDMLLESNVASIFGDDGGPGAGAGGPRGLFIKLGVPWTAPPVWPVGLPLIHPKRGPAQ